MRHAADCGGGGAAKRNSGARFGLPGRLASGADARASEAPTLHTTLRLTTYGPYGMGRPALLVHAGGPLRRLSMARW